MNELFEKKSLPFYKFGDAIYLQKIGTADWIDYICGRFEATGKHISKELAEKICQKVDNHSSYVQQLAWLVWIHTDKIATEQDFEEAYQDIIDQNTPLFEKQTESLTTYQMNFLRAILDGIHSEFTTQEVLQKYQLGSSANVSIVKRALVKKSLSRSKASGGHSRSCNGGVAETGIRDVIRFGERMSVTCRRLNVFGEQV